MTPIQPEWQLPLSAQVPPWFLEAVKPYCPNSEGKFAAQLLWQRGIQSNQQLAEFLDRDTYQPTSPFAFGEEMDLAVQRLQQARLLGEKVTIWGDFDADGVTGTSVLWEGLGQFFTPDTQLNYYIPNRLTESHGLNKQGLEILAKKGTKLIVTCDTGSTNLPEIAYGCSLGLDFIITDHHTLPPTRPQVTAIINPRYLETSHPLYHLAGVAVAYKLIEALYETLPEIPQEPLESLLDLVAIGLIADLVEITGDCRYLAKKGIEKLRKQQSNPTRPGVAQLLKLCKQMGDRPTAISFGIGPRINAISRIWGDARLAVELLTSRDKQRCERLALDVEMANTRRKELQKKIADAVHEKLERLDLEMTNVIVLADEQWTPGVLGLVASKIAQEYGRPTILLSTEERENNCNLGVKLAQGSARSIPGVDLYQLLHNQAHLLERFGGHPLAAGLSIPVNNIPAFTQGINQELRQKVNDPRLLIPKIDIDLVVTVADLGYNLFQELNLLEPCGMGNPVPRLLVKNCRFQNVENRNLNDVKGNQVKYIKTTFQINDDSCPDGFPGHWWGHYQEELPQDRECEAVLELEYTAANGLCQARLIAVSPGGNVEHPEEVIRVIDRRGDLFESEAEMSAYVVLNHCPRSWDEMAKYYREARSKRRSLALGYDLQLLYKPRQIWEMLVGIAKYLDRTGHEGTYSNIEAQLGITRETLDLGLLALTKAGFNLQFYDHFVQVTGIVAPSQEAELAITAFLEKVTEEQFHQEYFYRSPVEALESVLRDYPVSPPTSGDSV